MPDDELYAPALYSGWWAALGVVIVLLVVAWVVLAFRSTRASAEEKALRFRPSWATGSLDPYAGLRTEFEAHLDAVEGAYLAGGLDERGLHLALSKEVRGFASGRLGVDASVLTLSEIERMTGTAHLTRLIARYYHPSFAEDEALDASSRPGPGGSPDGRESINRARSVVRTW